MAAGTPYLGEVRLFSFNFAPSGWLACDGQTLPIVTNTDLFALIGITYGGNGTTNFALPDLRGRVPMHISATHPIGQSAGEETHTLTIPEIPSHTHNIPAGGAAHSVNPSDNRGQTPNAAYSTSVSGTQPVTGATGGSGPHNNLQPYLVMNWCIAVQGAIPTPP
jgi:microcystin-dependent protein